MDQDSEFDEAKVPPLSHQQEQQILRDWSAGAELEAGPDIVEMIGEQARARPEEGAVACEGVQLTYGQLDGRARRLAGYLRVRGVDAGVPVGVCLERSADQVVALLAILRAGGAYVPLDPEAPAERNRLVVGDTAMPVVVTQERLRATVAAAGAQAVVSLDDDRAVIEQLAGPG